MTELDQETDLTDELRKLARVIYIAVPKSVADDIAAKVTAAAVEIERLTALTEGDPTSVYSELAEARAWGIEQRRKRLNGTNDPPVTHMDPAPWEET